MEYTTIEIIVDRDKDPQLLAEGHLKVIDVLAVLRKIDNMLQTKTDEYFDTHSTDPKKVNEVLKKLSINDI